jgi:hypothetical protein
MASDDNNRGSRWKYLWPWIIMAAVIALMWAVTAE